jgi:hypothetical protein
MVDPGKAPGYNGLTPITAQEVHPQAAEAENQPQPNMGDMTYDDARVWYESRRQDPAALARRLGLVRKPAMTFLTSPVCPYCTGSLGNRKPPHRRSTFMCKACGEQVYADPKQELFASVYLTEKQKALVDYLWQLDHWVFTAGTLDDYYWAKAQIGKADKSNTDDVVSDTIWFLLNYNLQNVGKINPGSDAFMLKTLRKDITGLIQEFKACQEIEASGSKRLEKGTCDGCGNSPRVLTKIESDQRVCRTCLREIRA